MDPIGSITLTLSVVAVFLLVLGLPFVKGINTKKNLMRHGILTIVALAVQAILIFVVMLPSLINHFETAIRLQVAFSVNTWLHIISGLIAFFSGFAYVALWLVFYSSRLMCVKAKKYMLPTLTVWILALIGGALIYFLQMF